MKFWCNVSVLWQAFSVVASNSIFACVVSKCNCRDNGHYIFYWYYVCCEPLEEFNPELEVLPVPRQETLWDPFIHPFNRWGNIVRKYRAGGMMWSEWLSLPMRDSRFSALKKYRDDLMSRTQDIYFYLGSNTRRERVWMSHPRQVFRSASWTSPTSFWIKGGSYNISGL